MRKHLKRVVSMLMVLAMVLAMLPVAAAASELVTVTPVTEIPGADQAVVIYSASAGGVFGGTASGGAIGVSNVQISAKSRYIRKSVFIFLRALLFVGCALVTLGVLVTKVYILLKQNVKRTVDTALLK